MNSLENLNELATELAKNHFVSSSVDMKKIFERNEAESVIKHLIDNTFEGEEADKFRYLSDLQNSGYKRNILVIGAGCTRNAFDDIPTANEAIKKIYDSIVLDKVRGHKLTFFYLINHYARKYRKMSSVFASSVVAIEELETYLNDYKELKWLYDIATKFFHV